MLMEVIVYLTTCLSWETWKMGWILLMGKIPTYKQLSQLRQCIVSTVEVDSVANLKIHLLPFISTACFIFCCALIRLALNSSIMASCSCSSSSKLSTLVGPLPKRMMGGGVLP